MIIRFYIHLCIKKMAELGMKALEGMKEARLKNLASFIPSNSFIPNSNKYQRIVL
jgi:hypothetical protein